MRARSAGSRVAARSVTAAVLVMLAGLWSSPSASAAPSPVLTTVVMRIVPRGPISVDSLVDLYATVTPASAAGNVVFSIDGGSAVTVRASLARGTAHVGPAGFITPGSLVVQATFAPNDPSAYTRSTSTSVRLRVSTQATLTILTSDAVPLIPGSGVVPGQRLTAVLAMFPPGSRVTLMWDGTQLGRRIAADARGGALAVFGVPARQKPGLHTVTARAGQIRASVRLLIGNSTATVQTSIRQPRPGHGGDDHGGDHGAQGHIPKTGGSHGTGTLPRTGSELVPMGAVAIVLISLGGALVHVARPSTSSLVVSTSGRHRAAP